MSFGSKHRGVSPLLCRICAIITKHKPAAALTNSLHVTSSLDIKYFTDAASLCKCWSSRRSLSRQLKAAAVAAPGDERWLGAKTNRFSTFIHSWGLRQERFWEGASRRQDLLLTFMTRLSAIEQRWGKFGWRVLRASRRRWECRALIWSFWRSPSRGIIKVSDPRTLWV